MNALKLAFSTYSTLFKQFCSVDSVLGFVGSEVYPVEKGTHLYYLSLLTHRREEPFISAGVVDVVLEEFRCVSKNQNVIIRAWCFLPGRLELLIEIPELPFDLRAYLKKAKRVSSKRFANEFGRTLWLATHPDRIEKTGEELNEEDIRDQIDQILNFPVEMELVDAYEDYPFLGAETEGLEG